MAAFVLADSASTAMTGDHGAEQRKVTTTGARGSVGFALLVAVTLDGVPENLAL